MLIGIDARLMYQTGVGRYIRSLIENLALVDRTNRYIVYVRSQDRKRFSPPNPRWTVRTADVRWHTFREQFVLPRLYRRDKLDVVHIPYVSIPLLYGGRMVVTIHDLIVLHESTGNASTLPLPLYHVRRFGYRLMLAVGLRKASAVIAVSEATKKEIVDHIGIPEEKISVTYEGVGKAFLNHAGKENAPLYEPGYFLYVGNAYPHKNVPYLIEAYSDARKRRGGVFPPLVLVGPDDAFYGSLRDEGGTDGLVYHGPADDASLRSLYAHARALVMPSRMEGFGLPPLEAMATGTKVLCSDIPVFREVYRDAVTYFPLDGTETLTDLLLRTAQEKDTDQARNERRRFALGFSGRWLRLARETKAVYEKP